MLSVRTYANFCGIGCVEEWENANCDGDSSDRSNLWVQKHGNGALVYSLLVEEIWAKVCGKIMKSYRGYEEES